MKSKKGAGACSFLQGLLDGAMGNEEMKDSEMTDNPRESWDQVSYARPDGGPYYTQHIYPVPTWRRN